MRTRKRHAFMSALLALLAASLAACTAPPSAPAASMPAAEPAATATIAAAAPDAPPPFSSDLDAHAGLRLDCRTDTDCAVKDVGNCCGTYLACVNADSPVDAAAVARECEDKGMAGVCGYPVIQGCICSAGTCTAAPTDDNGALLR
jgi:hypothetical protein